MKYAKQTLKTGFGSVRRKAASESRGIIKLDISN